jgi:hypothetical protein
MLKYYFRFEKAASQDRYLVAMTIADTLFAKELDRDIQTARQAI